MYATQEYIDILTIGLSAQTGIEIRAGGEWAADVKQKILYYKADSLRNLPFGLVRGLLLHEIAHIKWTEEVDPFSAVAKPYEHAIHNVYNAFEDLRIERELKSTYGDYATNAIDVANYYALIDKIEKSKQDLTSLSRIDQFLNLVLIEDLMGKNAIVRHNIYIRLDEFKTDKRVQEIFEENEDIIDQICNNVRWSTSTRKMAEIIDGNLIPIIRELLEEDEKEQQKKQQEDQGKEGEEEGQGQGQNQGKGQPQSRKGGLMAQLLEELKEQTGLQYCLDGHFKNAPPVERPTEAEALAILRPYSSTLAQRLRDILIERATIRYTGNTKSGRLLNRNAYKVTIPNETRIFSRRTNPDTPDYSVYIALDSSGSMASEGRAVYAFMGAVLLKDVCHRLNFPIKIFAYDTKAWELKRTDDYHGNGGGTNDATALDAINNEMIAGDNNIVFVVTDGETGRTQQFDTVKKELIKKGATIYGVGIGKESSIQHAIKHNYDPAIYVPEVKDLPLELIRTMRLLIKR